MNFRVVACAMMASTSALGTMYIVAAASSESFVINMSRSTALIVRDRGWVRRVEVGVDDKSELAFCSGRVAEIISPLVVEAFEDVKLLSGVGGIKVPGIGERAGVLLFIALFGARGVAGMVSCQRTILDGFPLPSISSPSGSSNIPGCIRRVTISFELVDRDRRLSLLARAAG